VSSARETGWVVTSKLWYHLLDMVNKLCIHDGGFLLNCFVLKFRIQNYLIFSIQILSDLVRPRKTLSFLMCRRVH